MTAALTDPTTELPAVDPAAAEYAGDAGVYAAPAPEPVPQQAPAPSRRRPGPAPNPNSKRQRAKAARAAAPRKRTTPNRPAAPAAPVNEVYERGARTILGWIASPAASASLALMVAAELQPDESPRRETFGRLGGALSLDAMTIGLYGPELATGVAGVADHLPWLAGALQAVAKVSPYAALAEVGMKIVLQMLCNHGLMPANPIIGTMAPADLLAQVKAGSSPE